jgi:hypothetical protein
MKSALEPSTQEVLAGLVERLTFHNGSGLNGPIRERLIGSASGHSPPRRGFEGSRDNGEFSP